MSENEIIDVEYSETDNKSESKDIVINADPMSAAVNGLFGAVNHITDAVKEYNICHEQEETKRAEIRAKLKLGMAEINAKKEIVLKQLENKHEIDMLQVKTYCELTTKAVDSAIDAVNAAVENAKQTNDFTQVIELLQMSNDLTNTRCQFLLEYMDRTSQNSELILPESNKPVGYLT